MYDVVVCGAGPGGAFAAKLLAEAGYDVVLLEKDKIPRDKPCAGWITSQVLKILKLSPSEFTSIQPMHGAVMWASDRAELRPYEISYRRPVSYGIRRIEFDSIISEQARDAGVELVDTTFVTNVIQKEELVVVQTRNNQEFKARHVIGADGTHSVVARACGLRESWQPKELAQSVVSETKIGALGPELTDFFGHAELFLNPKVMSYAWYFTKGAYLNLGLSLQMTKISPTCNARKLYESFLQTLIQIKHLRGVKLASLKAHTYPVYNGPYHYPTYGKRVLLVGDAGGFPINYTGEGIRPALLTGKFAAETLIRNLDLGRANLREYVFKWSKALRDEYIIGDVLQMIFSSMDYDLIKALFIEDRSFRGLFFDLFFNLKKPREALRRFLLYSPLLPIRYLRYGVKSLLENLLAS